MPHPLTDEMMPTTTAEWMMRLAEAMTDHDEEAMLALVEVSRRWMQPESEQAAQDALVEAAITLLGETA